jgi:hypothetical protein
LFELCLHIRTTTGLVECLWAGVECDQLTNRRLKPEMLLCPFGSAAAKDNGPEVWQPIYKRLRMRYSLDDLGDSRIPVSL